MRVVIAEDSVLLREGMAHLLDEAGFEVVGQAGNAEELILKVRSYHPDVAVIDIRMPPTQTDEGLRAAKQIRHELPQTGVLVLSAYLESEYALELLAESAEGVGYLLKDRVSDVEQFLSAVRRVGEGGSALDPEIVSRLVGRRRRVVPGAPEPQPDAAVLASRLRNVPAPVNRLLVAVACETQQERPAGPVSPARFVAVSRAGPHSHGNGKM